MPEPRKPVICRACHVQCGLLVDMDGGRPGKIHGDKDNPAYQGYSCIKGRRLGAYHSLPSRLLHSQKKQPDGSHVPIASDAAISEIAAKVRAILDRHGPRSIAGYIGTHGYNNLPTQAFAYSFFEAIGSPMIFTSVTIDQPGKGISLALHGPWLAGATPLDMWDVLLLVGTNPLVSMNGGLGINPARQLHEAKKRGMKLIVVDPRVTDCAAKADIHLQGKPGEDPAILAGIARILIQECLIDEPFVAAEAHGLEALTQAVAPFTPEMVEARAGVPAKALIEAARMFGTAARGAVSAGTGPNMSGRGNLVEYLVKTLTTLRGFWMRPGDEVPNPGVLVNRFPTIAASPGPFAGFGFGEKLRVRGLSETVSGLPTAALAEEILMPGDGRVKALFVFGGNPMLAWPDQLKAHEAMKALELLVCFDPHMSATGELAHYVIAPKLPFEFASTTMLNEMLGNFGPGWGYHLPYGQYSPPLCEPPENSDVVEEWQAIYGIAQELGARLHIKDYSILDPVEAKEKGTALDMQSRLSADDVWEMLTKNSPVPLSELKAKAEGGHVFARPKTVVTEKPADWQGRLDISNALMMAELAEIAAEDGPPIDGGFPYRVVSRRMHDVLNSCWHEDPILQRRVKTNPAFMNPSDMARDGIADGDLVELHSSRAAIHAIARSEDGVRPGCISITHAWGRSPGLDGDAAACGANTGRLTDATRDYDPYSGIPRMSGIPVRVRSLEAVRRGYPPAE